jgi:hypothetical protein
VVTVEDRGVLEGWVRGAKTEQRLALRGRIILAAAAGGSCRAIFLLKETRWTCWYLSTT